MISFFLDKPRDLQDCVIDGPIFKNEILFCKHLLCSGLAQNDVQLQLRIFFEPLSPNTQTSEKNPSFSVSRCHFG